MTEPFNLADKLIADSAVDRISKWVALAPGEFSFSDIDRDLKFITEPEKEERTRACEELLKTGILERSNTRRGWYRPVMAALVKMDLFAEDVGIATNIWLPMNITNGAHPLVKLFAGNIVTIGGEKDAGKTCFLLNTAITNRHKWNVHYFNSETLEPELKERVSKFDNPINEWKKVNFYHRSSNFADVVFSGENDLNVIDFLELHDEFWKVGAQIREIHDKLGKGIAIIAMQKKRGADDPRGGEFVKEKSRLHVDLVKTKDEYSNKMIIKVGKNWASKNNPVGLYCKYKLAGGYNMMPMHVDGKIWFREE